MGKKYFDENIKNKLEELEIKYDSSSWDSFEKKLDKEMIDSHEENLAFDEQIKEKMQGDIHHPFKEEHWQELSNRIDYENELTNKIYLFKIIELAILVLLAYSFFQIEPIKKPAGTKTLYAHSHIFDQINADKLIKENLIENSVSQDNLSKDLASTVFSSTIVDQTIKPIFFESRSLANDENKASEGLGDQSNNELVVVSTLDKTGIKPIDYNSTWSYREEIAIEQLQNEVAQRDIIDLPKVAGPPSEKWISFAGSADLNLVNTPTSFLINARDQLLNTTGFSTSITYNSKVGKNEFEIGAAYSNKTYDPDIREVFDINGESTYAYSLTRITFHIAQFPFSYKRYLVDNRKWAAYGAVGATSNFILFNRFSLEDQLIDGLWTNSTINKVANSKLLARNYPTGLLQNANQPSLKRSSSAEFRTEGDIFDNSFITSYLGFGLQRYLGTRKALFIQAGYHHQFFGDKLGPNQDQINTFSFAFGGKFRI